MKRIYIILLALLSFGLTVKAQQVITERVYISTDKECYLAGENIWLKFTVFDSLLQFSSLSKVGYVEISDTRKPYISHILSLQGGKGSARLKIPGTMPSGIYQLSGYTRLMRNEGPDVFFTMPIAVINTLQASGEDRIRVVKETGNQNVQGDRIYSGLNPETDKTVYAKRERVDIKLNHLPDDIIDLSLSVSKNDSISNVPDSPEINLFAKHNTRISGLQWLPEYEGHIITGKAVSLTDKESTIPPLSNIGFLGKDIKYIQGKPGKDNQYFFVLGNIYGEQQIVSSVETQNGNTYRMDLLAPYAGSLPADLPVLEIHTDKPYLEDRSIAMQINQLMDTTDEEANPSSGGDDYYHLRPTLSYDLDEYTRFNTMSQTFIEFVNRLSVRTVDGKRRIRVLREEDDKYNVGNTLVLLDGIPVFDHEEILAYNPHLVKKIHIYGGKYVFGGQTYTCMVSFLTHRGNLPTFKLDNGSQLIRYDCPHLPVPFVSPDYSNPAERQSRKPDLRHTLYWNPFPEGIPDNNTVLSFYTSDLSGEFKVLICALTKDGKEITGTTLFEVTD